MPLGQGITEMWQAVQDRIEVSGRGRTWKVTAGSFDSALAYARERFGEAAVVSRTDRDRWWPRVTLTVTTDPALAASAPPLELLTAPAVPLKQSTPSPTRPSTRRLPKHEQRAPGAAAVVPARDRTDSPPTLGHRQDTGLPPSLEAIFAHQEELRLVRQRRPDHDNRQALR